MNLMWEIDHDRSLCSKMKSSLSAGCPRSFLRCRSPDHLPYLMRQRNNPDNCLWASCSGPPPLTSSTVHNALPSSPRPVRPLTLPRQPVQLCLPLHRHLAEADWPGRSSLVVCPIWYPTTGTRQQGQGAGPEDANPRERPGHYDDS